MNGFTCGKRILTASFKEKEQNEQEERQVLSMKPINTYKKCLCCGSKHQATAERKKCLCGGQFVSDRHGLPAENHERRQIKCFTEVTC